LTAFLGLSYFLNSPTTIANTVHGYFIDGICKFRTPLRIRTDHGTENVEVAKTMLEIRGVEARPVITGKSVHNQRIERLWVDTGFQVIHKYKDIFYFLEQAFGLDPSNDIHLFSLHYVYFPRISKTLKEFSQSWNNHPLRTSQNRTPLQIWSMGFYKSVGNDLIQMTDTELFAYGIDWDGPVPQIETANNVQVPLIEVELTDEQLYYLYENFDPLRNDDNYGIDVFLDVLNYIDNCLAEV